MWTWLQARPEAQLPGGYGAALVQTLLALLAVCVLAWVVLRWASRRGLGIGRGRRIRVIEKVPLDARRAVHLIEVGGRVLLIGTGDAGAPTLLTEIDPESLPPETPPTSFKDVLLRTKPAAPSEEE